MKSLTSISTGSISILLPVYSYRSVLVSDTFLNEATYGFQILFWVRQRYDLEYFLNKAIRFIEVYSQLYYNDTINFSNPERVF